MGGQACVFYGAAQFSKDVDLALLASEENFSRLLAALGELNAKRIAVPRFDPALLARGHAVHFRCQGGEADRLRVDVMTRLRDLPEFAVLWAQADDYPRRRRGNLRALVPPGPGPGEEDPAREGLADH